MKKPIIYTLAAAMAATTAPVLAPINISAQTITQTNVQTNPVKIETAQDFVDVYCSLRKVDTKGNLLDEYILITALTQKNYEVVLMGKTVYESLPVKMKTEIDTLINKLMSEEALASKTKQLYTSYPEMVFAAQEIDKALFPEKYNEATENPEQTPGDNEQTGSDDETGKDNENTGTDNTGNSTTDNTENKEESDKEVEEDKETSGTEESDKNTSDDKETSDGKEESDKKDDEDKEESDKDDSVNKDEAENDKTDTDKESETDKETSDKEESDEKADQTKPEEDETDQNKSESAATGEVVNPYPVIGEKTIQPKAEVMPIMALESAPVVEKVEETVNVAASTQVTPVAKETGNSEAQTFIDKYLKSSAGNIYTQATNLNYKNILNGLSTWNKYTSAQKDAVNVILNKKIGKTYQTLLKEAQKIQFNGTTSTYTGNNTSRRVNTATESHAGLYGALMGLSIAFAGLINRKRKEQK